MRDHHEKVRTAVRFIAPQAKKFPGSDELDGLDELDDRDDL